ncbi:hypothetical protein DQ04_01841120 [Trypanosoma grayi]|uniref:hypothetical protein n=1 Tax=Trypanosoma grayi TaxID=71804 RepID=UPI0004F45523|nr:hypothetical protein DQ04_01841120 [Trypanosoma grayi]KEG12281.1 hypothetical protein DQ04_01841120 [Trypanosoma grayi]
MDEERYGSEEGRDLVPPPSPQHVLLAWKALLWGTVYAVLGVAVVVCVAMYASGMHCLSEVFVYLRGREDRARRRLEESGEDVSHYVLDLTNPSTVIQQAQDIWKALEALAEDEGESTREKKE